MPSAPAPTSDTLILEGIVTTLAADGGPHIAPMGPRVDRAIERLVLRPYRTSQTYHNLKRHGEGVFHVTDDVELIARAAVGQLSTPPATIPAGGVRGAILADACRWFAFRVTSLDDAAERTTIECAVVERGAFREFFGFNRAKHAVLEAAILATRIGILPPAEIQQQMQRLAVLIEKTAGDQERQAFQFLEQHLANHLEP